MQLVGFLGKSGLGVADDPGKSQVSRVSATTGSVSRLHGMDHDGSDALVSNMMDNLITHPKSTQGNWHCFRPCIQILMLNQYTNYTI